MAYNPFDKRIGELGLDDLQKLIEHKVAEGYWVEYKSDFPTKTEKIGRSLASFANTYGGWYIVGVKTDSHNVAQEICGFSLTATTDPISKVRDIAKSHIGPVPLFFEQVVTLDQDRAVLVVFIPDGQETPFISKDGRIYRRTHDSSDPISDLDRHALDRLYDKGRDVAKQFDKFCQDDRTYSQGEGEIIWVKVFLAPYPLGLIEDLQVLKGLNTFTSDSIEKLIEVSRGQVNILGPDGLWFYASIPFNTGQPTFQ